MHKIKRCIHCGSEYAYLISGGHMSDYRINNEQYCPDCMEVMLAALKNVPVKFDDIFVDASTEVTRAELLEIQEAEEKIRLASKGIYARRCFPGLMAPGGDTTDTKLIKHSNGNEYYLTEWKIDHEYTIIKKVYWDLIKDVPVREPDKKYSKDRVTLYNPEKGPRPVKEWSTDYFKVTPTTGPLGLALALRRAYDPDHTDEDYSLDKSRIDIWNEELSSVLGDKDVDQMP